MAAEATRKLLCPCGKQLGTFKQDGLWLACRFSPHKIMVPYTLSDFGQAIVLVEALREQGREERRERPV
ncbi:MAG: hypothetical protein HYV93_00595 [Candidatus Rokubacteria bacterium]|nr:hypothetical protein [Candidatus Rokubacteria bacterium]